MCLGGLFVPEAYITATRQYVAQANSWSLEELCLEVNVTTTQNAVLDACSFGVTGKLTYSGKKEVLVLQYFQKLLVLNGLNYINKSHHCKS